MAGEAHPVPSRTRKLSPLAPMVLRCSPWESRTPPASKGRFPLHVLRPAPGRPGAGLFLFGWAHRPRRDRASPQNGPLGALFCKNARSRRSSSCPARPLLACLGADAPPLTGRMTGRDGPFPSFPCAVQENDERGPSLPVVSRKGERASEGARQPRSWSGSRVRLRDSSLSRYCDLEGSTLRLPSWCRNDCLK